MVSNDATPWALKAEKLHKDYPGITAVQQLDFTISQGVVHGFLGPNGAGKSTSLRMMCGLLRPTSGRILVQGFDPVEQPFEVKSRVGLLPENPPLYHDMTVREYLKFAARLHRVEEKQMAQAIDRVLQLTNTTHVAHRLIGNLSKGYRQRIGIAQALVHDPSVVVLDEPTAGLDPESVVEVRALIKSLKKDKTVIFSSHLLHEVEEVCDTISIIAHGELMAHGNLTDVRQRFAGQAHVEVEVASCTEKQLAHIRQLPFLASVEMSGETSVRLSMALNTKEEVRGEIVRALVSTGVDVWSLSQKGPELEKIFLEVTRSRGEA